MNDESRAPAPSDVGQPSASAAPASSRITRVRRAPSRSAFVRWLHLERELWWLALAGWRERAPRGESGTSFTHHQQANWMTISAVLSLLIVIEGTVVHLWLQGAGYVTAAWVALTVHVYLLIWVMGDAQALRLHATRIVTQPNGERMVALSVGLRGSANIPVSSIARATTGTWDEPATGGELVSVTGFANLSLTFGSPVEFAPLLGKPSMVTSLRVQVDDPDGLIRAIGR